MRKLVTIHALLLVLAAGVEAQDPVQPPPNHQFRDTAPARFRSATSMVALNVTVTDGKKLITGLCEGDFEVYEDGVRQQVQFFDAATVPLDLVLLLDASSSMLHRMPTVHEAARAFMKVLRPEDRGAVVAFTERMEVVQELTSDAAAIESAINATAARGSTALHNAIYVALKEFGRAASAGGEVRRQAIVVLSDGEDTSSLITFDDVLGLARRTGVSIYTIGLHPEATADTSAGIDRRAIYSLNTLARETGAQSFSPASVHELKNVYSAIARELESQYSLAYAPSNVALDGQFRRIQVRVTADPSYRPRTRLGYTAESSRSTGNSTPFR